MKRYRRILVAVDGSESGRNAFRQACRISQNEKSWLMALTMIPHFDGQFQTLQTKESIDKALRAEGERIIEEIKKIAEEEDRFAYYRIEENSAINTIVDIAESGNYNLIVLGSKGRKDIEKTLAGSVTARIVADSRSDVLVVPKEASIRWESIVLATDGSVHSMKAAERAIDLALTYKSRIVIVSVVDVTDEFYALAPEAVDKLLSEAQSYVKDIQKKTESAGIEADQIVREGYAHTVIADLAKQYDAGLIVMGSHGRTGIKKLLMGSVTEKVIGYATCPVLIVRA
jgi:nucleotide-binding universal stress UspA family protein